MAVAIGIDLGTTNSAAAIVDPPGSAPRLLSRRSTLIPSVVSYTDDSGAPGTVLVGQEGLERAQELLDTQAANQTVFSVKRLMGRTLDEPEVTQMQRRYAYRITDSGNPEDRGVRVQIGHRKYTPTEVSAQILSYVAEEALAALGKPVVEGGDAGPVAEAVITVPAYFSETQRAATRAAAQAARLRVKKIIDEPTAAAIAFGLSNSDERHYALVYDLGGGTFDISLIQMADKQFNVLATEGDMWLGGDEFDMALVGLIAQHIQEIASFDPSENDEFRLVARQAAEHAKRQLSTASSCEINIPFAAMSPEGRFVDVHLTVSRSKFEDLIEPLVERTMSLVRQVLQQRDLDPEDITAVLPVGGSTLVPLVQRALVDLFGREKVRTGIDPLLCVAFGAALVAAEIRGVSCPNCDTENDEQATHCVRCSTSLRNAPSAGEIGLGEVTARSLGIETIDADGRSDVFAVIIPKSTPYPLQVPMRRTFFTNADDKVVVPVYEGEDPVASRNDLQGIIDYPLPERIAPNTPVTIEFNFDRDRVLTVAIQVVAQSKMRHEVSLSRDRPRPGITHTNHWLDKVDWSANQGESFLRRYADFLDPADKQRLRTEIDAARRAYRRRDRAECDQAREAIEASLLASGVATYLFICAWVNEHTTFREGEPMREAARALESAFRRKDSGKVQRLQEVIEQLLDRVLKQLDIQDNERRGLSALVRQRT